MSKHIAIENPDNICFSCLREFSDNQLNILEIPALGYGSQFDCWSTKIQLCHECLKKTNLKWWELEIEKFAEYDWCEKYKYEYEIFNYIDTLPVEGQELFYNRYSNGDCYYMKPQDWIDYRLNVLPHDKCKKYGLYSPEERQAYQERFPICKYVQLIKYKDGSSGCRCVRGAFGNKDGTAKGHQTQSECYNCTYFEVRKGEIMTVDVKEEEIKRLKRQIRILAVKLRELEGYYEN